MTCLRETENDGGHKAYKRAAHFENTAHNKERIRLRGQEAFLGLSNGKVSEKKLFKF